MRKPRLTLLAAVLAIAGTLAGTASRAQQVGPPFFPQTLPSNTVVGRTQAGVGPASAIPFSTLSTLLSISNVISVGSTPVAGGTNGQCLTISSGFVGSNVCSSGGSGSPGGSNNQVQYNAAGAFGGMSGSTWTDASRTLSFNFGNGAVGALTIAPGSADNAGYNMLSLNGATTRASNSIFAGAAGDPNLYLEAPTGGLLVFLSNGVDVFQVDGSGHITGANFTSALQGLAPASGGGTTNFLRADGSWAVPPGTGGGGGTPGGANTQFQYNNSGAFGGATGVTSTNGANITIASGNLILSGSGSGSTILNSAATGGGTLTLPAGTTTLSGLGTTETFTAPKTFSNSDLILLGSSTGTTTFTSANAGASNFTITVPAATDQLVGRATTDTLTNKIINSSTDTLGGVTITVGSDATGDLHYRNAGGIFTRLAIGTTGQLLTVSGGLPAWQTTAIGSTTFVLASVILAGYGGI